jgi:polyhydroxyalkanoate synthesis regulator phasin
VIFNLDGLDTWASALAAILGGVGVKVIDKLMSKRNEHFSEATRIREELRLEITSLRLELDEWKSDADEWRIKYYSQVEENLKTLSEMEHLRSEVAALKALIHSVHNQQ